MEAIQITTDKVKSYANEANVLKAIEANGLSNLRYTIVRCKDNGNRFTAVFIGQECLKHGSHLHFPTVG